MYDIAIIGGDIRQIYMAQYLKSHSYSVITYGLSHPMMKDICIQGSSLSETIAVSSILIGGTPFSKDGITIPSLTSTSDLTIDNFIRPLHRNHILFAGMLPENIKKHCQKCQIAYYDFMEEDSLAISNGIATAEGAIMEAIQKSNGNLHKSNTLVLGFGRCAKILAHKLDGLDAVVTIGARKDSDLAYADAVGYNTCFMSNLASDLGSFQYIFNTIPAMVLPRELLCRISKDTTIIDLASNPGGLDYKAAEKLELNATLSLGIPGKVAPYASARILADYVIQKLSCRKKVIP